MQSEHRHEIEAEENDLDAIVAKIARRPCDDILETIERINAGLAAKKEVLENAIISRNFEK